MTEFEFSDSVQVAMRAAASAVVRSALDAGAGPGQVRLYESALMPMIGTATLADPSGTIDATTGALSLQIATQAVAVVDGVMGYATLTDSDGTEVLTAPIVASNVPVANAVAMPALEVAAGATVYILTLTIG